MALGSFYAKLTVTSNASAGPNWRVSDARYSRVSVTRRCRRPQVFSDGDFVEVTLLPPVTDPNGPKLNEAPGLETARLLAHDKLIVHSMAKGPVKHFLTVT